MISFRNFEGSPIPNQRKETQVNYLYFYTNDKTMLWIFCRSALTIVTVEVVLANNLGPSIPATQYAVSVSEGVIVGQEIFTVPVSVPFYL